MLPRFSRKEPAEGRGTPLGPTGCVLNGFGELVAGRTRDLGMRGPVDRRATLAWIRFGETLGLGAREGAFDEANRQETNHFP